MAREKGWMGGRRSEPRTAVKEKKIGRADQDSKGKRGEGSQGRKTFNGRTSAKEPGPMNSNKTKTRGRRIMEERIGGGG